MTMDDYQYDHLDTQSPGFRLLKLRKGDSIKIECEIFHAMISDRDVVPYEALSYAWGSTELVENIEVGGRRLWITENLYSALQCLRFRDQDRILWIDAICINQSDKKEQSQQVLEMGRIFSFATRVIFWLGKPTAEATLLIKFLVELQETTVAPPSKRINTGDGRTWEKLWLSAQEKWKSQDRDWSTQQRRGLAVLLKRPWFERVWILQEVLNAQSAIVCSGVLSVSADIFALSPRLLGLSPDPHVQSVLDIIPKSLEADCRHNQRREDLINLLDKFHRCKATDKRDMIFALLGMSSEPFVHELLRPDYTKPIQQVIHNTIRYWFEVADVAISKVIHVLANLDSIRVTCLVPLERLASMTEMVQIPSHSETVSCIRDASLFLVEPVEGEVFREVGALCVGLNESQSKLGMHVSLGKLARYEGAIQVVPSQRSQGNIRLVIIKDVMRALLLISFFEYRQVFNFIVDRIIDDKPKLLVDLMLIALSDGYYDMVRMLLEESADVNVQGVIDKVLYVASQHGDLQLVIRLLEKGADVNTQGGHYGNALQAASVHDCIEIVQLLLERGADVNAQGGYYGNALQAASTRASLGIVQLLLEKGADVNAQGGYYGNALQAASRYGALKIVTLLLEKGAHVNAHGGHHNNALQAASLGRDDVDRQIEQILLNHGAYYTQNKQDTDQ